MVKVNPAFISIEGCQSGLGTKNNSKRPLSLSITTYLTAADILRGSLDPADYRQPIMTLLFIKRLNDTFEENAEKLIKEGKSQR